jgi:PAS domain S-box-containing protein
MVEGFTQAIDDAASPAEVLRHCREFYRVIVDGAYDWEYWLAPNGRFLYVSPSCQRITGCSSQQFLDDPELIVTITDPRDRERMRQHLFAERGTKNVPCVEFRIVTPSGEVRWIEHVCQSVFGGDGRWLGRRASNRDITQRKCMEQALVRERRMLRTLIDSMPEAVYVKDEEGRFLVANRAVAGMMGADSPDALLGRTDFDYYPEALAQRFREDEARVMASGQSILNHEEPGMTVTGEGRRTS